MMSKKDKMIIKRLDKIHKNQQKIKGLFTFYILMLFWFLTMVSAWYEKFAAMIFSGIFMFIFMWFETRIKNK